MHVIKAKMVRYREEKNREPLHCGFVSTMMQIAVDLNYKHVNE